jgi:2-aminoadipate transaminase
MARSTQHRKPTSLRKSEVQEMTQATFEYSSLFRRDTPEPIARWTGFPKFNFVGGHNDPDLIPVEDLIEATASALRREGRDLALYTLGHGPLGHEGLRAFLADKLDRWRGIKTTRDDILITVGSTQGIELINRILLAPGDTVILEEFVYFGALAKLRQLGINVVGAPIDQDGLLPDALADILRDLAARGIRPKYIYTIPTVQNPTGSILPLERRHRLLALAREYGVPVFEDECYADLIWQGAAAPPSLYALDPTRVIHIGSFSKSLSPSLRIGYVAANWDVISRLAGAQTNGAGALDQLIAAEYFSRHFDNHVRTLSEALAGKLDVMVEAIEREFGIAAEIWKPKGGIYLWLKLPDTIDVRSIVGPAAAAGIAFNAGPVWSVDPDAAKSYLRLCFALPSKQEIADGIAALAQVFFEQTGIPAQSSNVRKTARG